MTARPNWTRRSVLRLTAGGLSVAVLWSRPAAAQGAIEIPERVGPIIEEAFGTSVLQPGRIAFDIPVIAETGLSVPVTFRVESPMTEADHVRRIMAFVPGNPEPIAADYLIGPRAGLAEISTRIRVARTQTVLAGALLSDGSTWGVAEEIMVTQGACFEENIFLADQLAAEARARARGEIP